MESLPALDAAALGRTLIVSPHDDDAAIGCGGLIQVLPAPPLIAIVTDGRLGYERASERETIVARRRAEALACYERLGVPNAQVRFLEFPDLSLRAYLCFETEGGRPGAYQALMRLFREHATETVLLPNALDFHPDHQAAHEAGRVAAAIGAGGYVADLGPAAPLRALYAYEVWEALASPSARLVLDDTRAGRKREALRAYASQARVLEELERRQTLSFSAERFARLPAP